jgi:predicted phosphodiesterase
LRRLLRAVLYRPLLWVARHFSSRPDRTRVHTALSRLAADLRSGHSRKGPKIHFVPQRDRFIIFSDQHKGAKDGADIFASAEVNYLAALKHYTSAGYHFISLGDNEELWENSIAEIKKYNRPSFDAELPFIKRQAFTKIFGNHDLYWANDPFASRQLADIYGIDVAIAEGIILQAELDDGPFTIYCTHGHQGDAQSDGNAFSKLVVARVWGPLQNFLQINPNTPSCNDELKTVHNQMMYEWSSLQKNLLLITGHTHQPVFESLTHLERLYRKRDDAVRQRKPETVAALDAEIKLHGFAKGNFPDVKPTYFNSGCCCFDDGDITGIEIADGMIRLIKWDSKKFPEATRVVLEETTLAEVAGGTR